MIVTFYSAENLLCLSFCTSVLTCQCSALCNSMYTLYRHIFIFHIRISKFFASAVILWLVSVDGFKYMFHPSICTLQNRNILPYSVNFSNVCLLPAQRSAHELPMVEKQNMDSCSVLGGQQMILTGQNFSADSKVIFTEKTHGELHLSHRKQ